MPKQAATGDNALQPVTTQIRLGLLNKLDYVTWYDRKASRRQTIDEAIEELISKWEKKNGTISAEQIAAMHKATGA